MKKWIQGMGGVLAMGCGFAAAVAQAAPHGMYLTRDLRELMVQLEGEGIKHPKPGRDTTLLYYGGPVIAHAKVGVVFWGPNVDSTTQSQIPDFYAALVKSSQMTWLDSRYNTKVSAVDGRAGTQQDIGTGTYIGQFVITPEHTATSLDDKDIQDELERQIDAGHLPKPDADTLYMIHFPAGLTITIDGSASCSSFCAYHEGFTSAKYGPVFYGVMPDQGGACAMGCGMSSSAFNSLTSVSSHELVEAVTDPFPTPGDKPAYPQAWNTNDGQEIADLCAGSDTKLLGSPKNYNITQEFDNQTHSCANINHKY